MYWQLSISSSSLDNLVGNANEDDFKSFIQEFDKNKLDLVKQKGVYPYEYISDFEKLFLKSDFWKQLTRKKKF